MTTFLITGAGRGLGLELARQLSRRPGATIIATARRPDGAPELPGLAHEVHALDVADEEAIRALGERLRDRPGGIDVLINNAGVSSEHRSVGALTQAELRRVFDINAFAPILLTRALLPCLRAGKRRTVVNITSVLGSIAGNSGGSSYPYRASKAALNMLTVSLAHELKPEGFCCVAVHPGWVRTDMGGAHAPLSAQQSVGAMLSLIDGLKPGDSGRFLSHDGETIAW